MVTNNVAPTFNIAKLAYGYGTVKMLIKGYIYHLAVAYNVKSDENQIDMIAEDVMSGYGDLKVTEFMLAFKMMREGRFRRGEDDRSKMYGGLSSEVICDCLYQFRHNYRNEILRKQEDEENKRKREQSEYTAATYEQKREILANKCLDDPWFLELIIKNQWLMEKDIMAIKNAIKELEALRLLRTRVEQYVEGYKNGVTDIAKLEKAIDYFNKNYPKKDDKQVSES